MAIIKLTQELVSSGLTCPPGKKRDEMVDSDLPGLYIALSAAGKGIGCYNLRYKVNGVTKHKKIGRTCDLTLAEARKKARELKAEIALGADPRAEEKAIKEVIMLRDFYNDHYLPYVKPRKRSWKRDAELYNLRIDVKFGSKRLNQITRQQIQEFHSSLLDDGLAPATADHHLKFLKHAFNLATDWGLFRDKNPCSRIPLFRPDNRVEHYMNDEELARLLTVLKNDSNRPVCRIALFLLSTGARLNEALKATWNHIDEENRTWRIPATNSKSKRIRSIPLNDTALEVLAELNTKGKHEFVFVNTETDSRYTTVYKVWQRLRKEAGLPHLRLHDLRHQTASMLINSGYTLYTVQQILGHSDPSVTTRYAHLSTATLQEASNSASAKIKAALKAA